MPSNFRIFRTTSHAIQSAAYYDSVAPALLHLVEGTLMSTIELVDQLIKSAIDYRVSDIHLEPSAHNLRIRWRIDGVLVDRPAVENNLKDQVLSRIKVLAHIDIAEKRMPHDGKFVVIGTDNRLIDLRVSTFPSIYGEKVVIRILDRINQIITLDRIGMMRDMQETFERMLARPQGFMLVAGPTGSGKTTTLYAALSWLHAPDKNIVTLEDPVEYSIDGTTQSQIHPDIGFTFERGLRSLLRQDPNIIMIGEIRDLQTARVAIEAALTGHLIVSTIHTHDTPTALMRLIDMGIEPFLLNSALTGIVAQRLSRTICPACRTEHEPTDIDLAHMTRLSISMPQVYYGIGCEECQYSGYRGRVGVFELLQMTPALRTCLTSNPVIDTVRNQAVADGMQTLLQDGIAKVTQGIISLRELVRTIL